MLVYQRVREYSPKNLWLFISIFAAEVPSDWQVFATTSRGAAAASSARPAPSAEGKVWRPRQQWLRLGREMGGCTQPGKHTKSYWKEAFIVDLPIKHGDFP